MPSSEGESHPFALTEPDVTLSRHPARPVPPQGFIRLRFRHQLFPSRVDRSPKSARQAPSLPLRSQASLLLQACPSLRPASVRSSWRVLRLDFSLRIEAAGSHVPYTRLYWAHAVYVPTTTRTVSRHPPSFVPDLVHEPGFDGPWSFRHVLNGSLAFVFPART